MRNGGWTIWLEVRVFCFVLPNYRGQDKVINTGRVHGVIGSLRETTNIEVSCNDTSTIHDPLVSIN